MTLAVYAVAKASIHRAPQYQNQCTPQQHKLKTISHSCMICNKNWMVLPVRKLKFFFIIYAPSLHHWNTLLSAWMIAASDSAHAVDLWDIVSLTHFYVFHRYVSYSSFCWQLKKKFISHCKPQLRIEWFSKLNDREWAKIELICVCLCNRELRKNVKCKWKKA